jgi:hypothetical protein
MCRNIKTLANFDPPASDAEIRASAIQFVRKLSGASRPSRANEAAFDLAVEEVTAAATRLLHSLTISAPPRNREEEARRAKERSRARFGTVPLITVSSALDATNESDFEPHVHEPGGESHVHGTVPESHVHA